jgi:hypothetical protein
MKNCELIGLLLDEDKTLMVLSMVVGDEGESNLTKAKMFCTRVSEEGHVTGGRWSVTALVSRPSG